MKTYKHKETKMVVTKDQTGDYYRQANTGSVIHSKFVEGDDNWELFEINYEILEMTNISNKSVFTKDSRDLWSVKNGRDEYTLEFLLKISYIKPTAVKRLEDQHVFKVGDDIQATDNIFYDGKSLSSNKSGKWMGGNDRKIFGFKLVDGRMLVVYDSGDYGQCIEHIEPVFMTDDGVGLRLGDVFCHVFKLPLDEDYQYNELIVENLTNRIENHYYYASQHSAEKQLQVLNRKPLFTTVDGVELFKGDMFYSASLNYDTLNRHTVHDGVSQELAELKGWKWFSTREKAREYLKSNVKIYTEHDIIKYLGETALASLKTHIAEDK